MCIPATGPVAGRRGLAGRQRLVGDCQIAAVFSHAARLALCCLAIAERRGVCRVCSVRWFDRLRGRRMETVVRDYLPSMGPAGGLRPGGYSIELYVIVLFMSQRTSNSEGSTKMSANVFKNSRSAMFVAAVAIWAFGGTTTSAYAQGCCGGGQHASAHGGGHSCCEDGAAESHAEAQPPHGGQVTKMEPLTFEVVYLPQEFRVYIYGLMPYPESARKARGEVVMQVRDNPRAFRYPLHYVAPPTGSSEQDYLATTVDLTKVRDGDMRVTLNLENLPLPHHPKLTFVQTFALSKTQPQITLAALSEGDREGIARAKSLPCNRCRIGRDGRSHQSADRRPPVVPLLPRMRGQGEEQPGSISGQSCPVTPQLLTRFLNTLFQKELDHVEVSSMDAVYGCPVVGGHHWMRDHRNPEGKRRFVFRRLTGGARFVPLDQFAHWRSKPQRCWMTDNDPCSEDIASDPVETPIAPNGKVGSVDVEKAGDAPFRPTTSAATATPRKERFPWWIKLAVQPMLLLSAGVLVIVALGAAQKAGWISSAGGGGGGSGGDHHASSSSPGTPTTISRR